MGKITIGRTDKIDLPKFGLQDIAAKIDTGAKRSAIHCTKIMHAEKDGKEILRFNIPLADDRNEPTFETADFEVRTFRSSFGEEEKRYIINTDVVLFGKSYATSFSLTDRTGMKYPVLLGRKLLASRFVVDVDLKDVSFGAKEE